MWKRAGLLPILIQRKYLGRITTINNTRIKFIRVLDKLYEVEKISFYDFSVAAKETDFTIDDVPESEVFNLTDFKDFRVKLRNWHGNVVDFMKYVRKRNLRQVK